MKICAHISKDSFAPYQENFNLRCIHHLAQMFPGNSFILFAGKNQNFTCSEPNCTIIKLPAVNNRIQKYFLYSFRLPALLKRNKTDIIIPAADNFYNSGIIPQIPVIQNPSGFIREKRKWKKKNFGAMVVTAPIEEKWVFDYPVTYSKHGMHVDFRPFNEEEKSRVRKQFTEDHEYFFTEINAGCDKDLMLILKAFSIFKKWQRSSLKLVVLLHQPENAEPVRDFNLYKYKNDVVLLYYTNFTQMQRAALTGAAYACVLRAHLQIICSVKCHVPPITIATFKDAYGDAVHYSDNEEKSSARGMIEIYKNEMYRSALVASTARLSLEYTWENAATQLWKAIENSIQ